jgi:hypothetical protein
MIEDEVARRLGTKDFFLFERFGDIIVYNKLKEDKFEFGGVTVWMFIRPDHPAEMTEDFRMQDTWENIGYKI